MSVDIDAAGSPGRTRRAAIRSGGAALIVAAAIAHARGAAVAQDATPDVVPSVPPDFKVVLHAAQVQNWQFVLSNLKNLANDWPHAQVRVVVDGSAVTALQGDNDLTQALTDLAAGGLQLHVCPNALREHGIDPATIPGFAVTDLGGVVALVQAQHEGFAYVKP